jgi:transposase InsO family protein
MLGNAELLAWLTRVGLPESGRSTIHQVRSSDPARRVGGGHRNVSGRYPSKKMGVTIQFESHRVELARIYELEHDPNVLEYWDQPPSFKLEYKSALAKRVVALHTPDYFVIRVDQAGWEECKTEEELVRWFEKSPQRYCRDQNIWRCPPGEEYARPFGLTYCVRSSRDIDWVYQRNIQFLEDYLRDDRTSVLPTVKSRLVAQTAACPGITLQELLGAADGNSTCDDIYSLIALGELYVDLYKFPLAQPASVPVFVDWQASTYADHNPMDGPKSLREMAISEPRSGDKVDWDGQQWDILNCGQTQVTLRRTDGDSITQLPTASFYTLLKDGQVTFTTSRPDHGNSEISDCLSKADEKDLQTANYRYEIVRRLLDGGKSSAPTPSRTTRRWVAMYKKAEGLSGSGYLGLLPQTHRRGNKTAKLPEATQELMATVIQQDYEKHEQKSIYASWSALQSVCQKQGLTAPSYETFRQAVHARGGHSQKFKREGPRAAYQREPFYWELELKTPRHGDRPFEIAHVDHTELDIELVCSATGRNLGRPWLSLLTDAFSRRVLASSLCFDPPSYRSCMMIFRDCVARHNRLPQIFVVDGGAEFNSVYFETVLARYECTKKTRPPAKARFGSVIERLFGVCNSQFIHNLRGNTQIMRHVRQVTMSVNPKYKAIWTLPDLYDHLTYYLYEIYDSLDHPALGQSPRDTFAAGIARAGQRPGRCIRNDREFLIMTLPTTPMGTAQITPGRGVKIHYIYYWSDLFHDPETERKQVPVRYDAFDAGTAFAFVKGQWVQCISEHYSLLHGHTERELMLATQELRKRQSQHAQQRGLSAKTIGDFLQSLEAQQILLTQRLRDHQARETRCESEQVVAQHSPSGSQVHFCPSCAAVPSQSAALEAAEEYETYGVF